MCRVPDSGWAFSVPTGGRDSRPLKQSGNDDACCGRGQEGQSDSGHCVRRAWLFGDRWESAAEGGFVAVRPGSAPLRTKDEYPRCSRPAAFYIEWRAGARRGSTMDLRQLHYVAPVALILYMLCSGLCQRTGGYWPSTAFQGGFAAVTALRSAKPAVFWLRIEYYTLGGKSQVVVEVNE